MSNIGIAKYDYGKVSCGMCRVERECDELYLNAMYIILCEDCQVKLRDLLNRNLEKIMLNKPFIPNTIYNKDSDTLMVLPNVFDSKNNIVDTKENVIIQNTQTNQNNQIDNLLNELNNFNMFNS